MGAGTCLILAGTTALVLVSTLIAFQGWPGVRTDAQATNAALLTRVRDEGQLAARRPARLHLPAPARVASASHVRHAAPARAAGRSAAPRAALASVTHARDLTSLPADHAVVPPVVDATPKAKAKATAPLGTPVRQVGSQLDKTVSDTGKTLGDVVTPVAPSVGSLVTNTTDVVGDVVTRVTDVAGQLVDGLGTKPAAP